MEDNDFLHDGSEIVTTSKLGRSQYLIVATKRAPASSEKQSTAIQSVRPPGTASSAHTLPPTRSSVLRLSNSRRIEQHFVPQQTFVGHVSKVDGSQVEALVQAIDGVKILYAFEADNLPPKQRERLEEGVSVTVHYGSEMHGRTKRSVFKVYLNLPDASTARVSEKISKIAAAWDF